MSVLADKWLFILVSLYCLAQCLSYFYVKYLHVYKLLVRYHFRSASKCCLNKITTNALVILDIPFNYTKLIEVQLLLL